MTQLGLTLEKLETISPAQLRAAWREQYRSPAPDIGPDLLRRGIAYRMQERQFGKLASSTKRELDRIGTRLEQDGEAGTVSPARLKPGTRLIRSRFWSWPMDMSMRAGPIAASARSPVP
jgi:hypothetical protein